jgi:hypothetical protein
LARSFFSTRASIGFKSPIIKGLFTGPNAQWSLESDAWHSEGALKTPATKNIAKPLCQKEITARVYDSRRANQAV